MNRSGFLYTLAAAILCCSLLLFTQCKTDEKPSDAEEPTDKVTLKIPSFDRDSAYAYVERQVNFGPRVPNSEAHAQTAQWLVDKLSGFGFETNMQQFTATAYTGEKLNAKNIIAQSNPDAPRRVLLTAHWDTRHIADKDPDESRQDEPILGADDGGSGVGVLLEVARQIQQNPIPNLGVDIVLFDVEDYGKDHRITEEREGDENTWGMGSQYWSTNPHVDPRKYSYGLLLDMVGSKDARFGKEAYSMQIAPNLVKNVWDLAQQMGYGNLFVNADGGGVWDDHVFVAKNARIPIIDIVNKPDPESFGDYHHTHADNMDVINRRTLKAVGQVVLATIYRHANGTF